MIGYFQAGKFNDWSETLWCLFTFVMATSNVRGGTGSISLGLWMTKTSSYIPADQWQAGGISKN